MQECIVYFKLVVCEMNSKRLWRQEREKLRRHGERILHPKIYLLQAGSQEKSIQPIKSSLPTEIALIFLLASQTMVFKTKLTIYHEYVMPNA